MKGYFKIEAVDMDDRTALRTDCCLSDVSFIDRMQLMHAASRALQLDSHDLKVWLLSEMLGVFGQATEETVLRNESVAVNMQELLKQMREEGNENGNGKEM